MQDWEEKERIKERIAGTIPHPAKYTIGLRTIKTAVAVFICLLIHYVSGADTGFYSSIAAIVCMRETSSESWKIGVHRFWGTLIGGILGYMMMKCSTIIPGYFDGLYVILVPIGLVACIWFCLLVDKKNGVIIGCVVFVSLCIDPTMNTDMAFQEMVIRIVETTIGIVVAGLLNTWFFPHDQDNGNGRCAGERDKVNEQVKETGAAEIKETEDEEANETADKEMHIKKVYAVYFSATGTTEKVAVHVAKEIAVRLGTSYEVIDFTLPRGRERELSFEKSDLVVFGVPVYAGRVPNVLLPYLNEKIRGGGAAAVSVVLFGNRNYDDGLMELRNILVERGFCPIAAGAFIGEHSFSRILAAGRPDDRDMAKALELARMTAERVKEREAMETCGQGLGVWGEPAAVPGNDPVGPYYTPRDRDGNPVDIRKVKPKTKDSCSGCGLCIEVCPMGSIDSEDVSGFTGICIKCGACIKKCPAGARYYDDEAYIYHMRELEEGFARRAEPEIF